MRPPIVSCDPSPSCLATPSIVLCVPPPSCRAMSGTEIGHAAGRCTGVCIGGSVAAYRRYPSTLHTPP
eukprot:3501680-Rhodomonas_salina.1